MVKIIKKAPKKNTAKPEEIKPKPDEPKPEFTFEATGKTKEEFDKAEKVIKGLEETSLLFLRSEWLLQHTDFCLPINLRQISSNRAVCAKHGFAIPKSADNIPKRSQQSVAQNS